MAEDRDYKVTTFSILRIPSDLDHENHLTRIEHSPLDRAVENEIRKLLTSGHSLNNIRITRTIDEYGLEGVRVLAVKEVRDEAERTIPFSVGGFHGQLRADDQETYLRAFESAFQQIINEGYLPEQVRIVPIANGMILLGIGEATRAAKEPGMVAGRSWDPGTPDDLEDL